MQRDALYFFDVHINFDKRSYGPSELSSSLLS